MRFSNQALEFGLVWVHLIIFSMLVIGFSLAAWREIGYFQHSFGMSGKAKQALSGAALKSKRKLDGQRSRILRIAMWTSLCLLCSLVATLTINGKLREWDASSDLRLQCSFDDDYRVRNIADYGFVDGQEVCSQMDVIESQSGKQCQSPCTYHSKIDSIPACSTLDGFELHNLTMKEALKVESAGSWSYCDCPCNSIAPVELPSVEIMGLSFVAKSLVVAIVGLNLALR
jgi:hypothetical protein